MIFETHCHLNSPELYSDLTNVINKALDAGVKKMLVVGYDYQTSLLAVDLASQYDFIYAAIGFHPTEIDNVSKADAETFSISSIKQDIQSEKFTTSGGHINIDLPMLNADKDDKLAHLLRSNGIIARDSKEKLRHTNFNRFQFTDPYIALGTTREYLFFTKPDLHLVNTSNTNKLNSDLAHIPYFIELKKKYPEIIHQLQKSSSTSKNPFMPLLSNMVSNTLDLPGISSDTVDTGANIYGTSIVYRGISNKSSENVDFSLEFKDGIDLEVYHLFKAWNIYSDMKQIGLITNPPGNNGNNYINPYRAYKILHDQIAIYKIVVADDGETIVYYACLYGAFPKSVPREAFSDLNGGGHISYNIDWHAQFVYDSDPLILRDFNVITYNHWKTKYAKNGTVPIWSNKYHEINGGYRHCPLIVEEWDSISKMYRPKLKWV